MDDLISRTAATRAAVISVRDYLGNINSERDIHIEEGLYEVPAVDAVPIADAKAIADIALHAISKMEDFGCAYVWEKSGDPYADENNIRGECQYYRRKIKNIKERWRCDNDID